MTVPLTIDGFVEHFRECTGWHGYAKARRIGMLAMEGGKNKKRNRNHSPRAFADVLLDIARHASAKPAFYCSECGEAIESERGLCEGCEADQEHFIKAVSSAGRDSLSRSGEENA